MGGLRVARNREELPARPGFESLPILEAKLEELAIGKDIVREEKVS